MLKKGEVKITPVAGNIDTVFKIEIAPGLQDIDAPTNNELIIKRVKDYAGNVKNDIVFQDIY